MQQLNDDVITGEFYCPRCGGLLKEKRPKADTHLVCNKEFIVRLMCQCGHYEDKVVKPKDFLD